MNKDIEQIFAEVKIRGIDILRVPKEKMESYIKSNLARELSIVMTRNINDLPIEYTIKKDYDESYDNEIHRLTAYLISDKELARLKEIEKNYNDILNQNN